jgi:adenine-specific DNA-methyltransferase
MKLIAIFTLQIEYMTVKKLQSKTPKLALNKAFLKIKPNRTEIDNFKSNLILLLDKIKLVEERPKDESEEHLKNDIRDFLRDTYYKDTNAINTKDKSDLVIHMSKDTNSNVGVIIEAKRPSNKNEMLSKSNLNKKALQELVLYYLRERITNKNLDIKNLIVTNINEWFIFDENLFERLFTKNKSFVKQFDNFEFGKKSTSVFYKEIAEPFIQSVLSEIEYTYFNLNDFQNILRNEETKDDNQLISLFKLLSPPHLLKLPFNNDSNSLDENFYSELLHIIGLVEIKEGNKKLIKRLAEKHQNAGSLLENTINQLDSLDKLSRLTNVKQYGETKEERLFNVGLELCITWVNRILFLKLLEAQLISYHKGDKSYSFLNFEKIKDYDNLNSLFFMVLAKKPKDRNQRVKDLFSNVPYLNSSLFEPTILEHETLFIAGLEDNIPLPFLKSTVIKDNHANKEKGSRDSLRYLFDFLGSYDYNSEGSEEIQEDNKTLINASVLGLIFEKINGYKDGSFYTPGYITMFMCRETIRKSVIQKFNNTKNWDCQNWEELYENIEFTSIEGRKEANSIINSIKICDPAVGSGHYLVSALNEIISIKNDLKVLQDREGKRLKEYKIEVIGDELIITDEEGEFFEYRPLNTESQRVQETLFHEKETVIENCLFGVDINPNSVKICRLRLWIELLKSAYYINKTELETLPNIDINIKCGNSLVSRFSVDTDLKEIMKRSKRTIDGYKNAVDTYRNAESKEQKWEMERLINEIKSDFRIEITQNDPKVRKLYTLNGELTKITTQQSLFEIEKKEKNIIQKQIKKLNEETKKLTLEIEEVKSNKIYENAFEWRFEFPEVLNDEGEFLGFDVIIGNPPWGSSIDSILSYLKNRYPSSTSEQVDSFKVFIELSLSLLKEHCFSSFIVPNTLLRQSRLKDVRRFMLDFKPIQIINLGENIFEDVVTPSCIYEIQRLSNSDDNIVELKDISSTPIKQREHFLLQKDYNKLNIPQKEILCNSDYCFSETLHNISSNIINLGSCDFFTFKDVGLQCQRKNVGKENRTKSDLAQRIFIDSPINKFSVMYWKGRDINKYYTQSETERYFRTDFKELVKVNEIVYFNKVVYETSPKIMIRQTADHLIAALDTEKRWFDGSVIGLVPSMPSKYDIKYILGLFNSKYYKWYYQKLVNEEGRVFAQVKLTKAKQLPFKLIDFENKSESQIHDDIVHLVNEIIVLKKQDNTFDTQKIENEIDLKIYKLFDLRKEDIDKLNSK